MKARDLFLKQGYCHIPGVLCASRVAELREACITELNKLGWDSGAYVQIPVSRFVAAGKIARVPFEPPVVDVLKELMGDCYITIPSFTVQANSFGGWHRDSGSQGYAPHLYERDYLQVTCAMYLQDNHLTHGGGLDLKPRSHHETFRVGKPSSRLRRLARRLESDWCRAAKTIETKVGDLVVFHFNVLHRATPRTMLDPSKESVKLGVFWGACADEGHARLYLQHMQTIDDNIYKDLGTVHFPADYHSEAVGLIQQQRLRVASY
jgi:hypothetical protein